jgi:nitrate reductase NapE component
LCELGASASAEYLSFIEADIQEGLQRLRWSVVLLYGIMIPACWILTPAFFICTVLAWSRLDCKTRALAAVGRQQVLVPAVATAGPVAPANAEAKLANAEAKGRQLRLRVSGTFVQLAWMLFVLALGSTGGLVFGVDLTLIAGPPGFYNAALPWAIALLFLSLRPTDTRAITFTCIIIFAIFLIAWLTGRSRVTA